MIEDDGAAQQQQRTEEAPVTMPPSDKNPTNSNERNAQRDHQSCREWVRFILEIFALAGLFYYAHQARRQADASKDAAEAMHDQVVMMRHQLTAVVGILGMKGPDQPVPDRPWFEATVRNNGGGPAQNAKWTGEILVVPAATPCTPISPAKQVGTAPDRAGVSIGVAQESRVVAAQPFFNDAERELVNTDQGVIIFKGTVTYDDLFGDSHPELFCFRSAKDTDGRFAFWPCFNACPSLGY